MHRHLRRPGAEPQAAARGWSGSGTAQGRLPKEFRPKYLKIFKFLYKYARK